MALTAPVQVIPSTLAENSGMHPISLVTELRCEDA
jgi:chaperonin GroEL (HSP60 family)